MNKPVNLGLSILELSKILMCEFWYDYVKPKNGEKAKLCYMDIDSFIAYIKTDYNYEDINDFNDSKAFIESSNNIRNICKNIEE